LVVDILLFPSYDEVIITGLRRVNDSALIPGQIRQE